MLICDDAVLYATMLSAWFGDDPDVEVVGTAASATEAFGLADRVKPDVIVLDHMLPEGSSPELMPQLRERAPGAAVVLISGLPPEALAETARQVGADAWVPKASTQEEIRAGILRAAGLDG